MRTAVGDRLLPITARLAFVAFEGVHYVDNENPNGKQTDGSNDVDDHA